MIDPVQLSKLEALILDMDRRITFLEQRCDEHPKSAVHQSQKLKPF